jgi:hypothetical protein
LILERQWNSIDERPEQPSDCFIDPEIASPQSLKMSEVDEKASVHELGKIVRKNKQ